ncbi:MAG: PilZ domain-containing protein [Myxococcales bacterium]|nr:PilZ domain-containing protein [Myxococcales bacterium]
MPAPQSAGQMRPRLAERRAHPRVRVLLDALVLVEETHGLTPHTIVNLSAGGALLVGEPVHPVGAEVTILVQMARRRQPLRLRGSVVRVDVTAPSFAVRFSLAPKTEDLVQELVTRCLLALK